MNNNVAVLVDGFNLYHSLQNAIDDGAPNEIKWLNFKELVERNCLYAFGSNAKITTVRYFSSLQTWRQNDGSLSRHRAYIRALATVGISVHYGQFKEKEVLCKAKPGGCLKPFRISVEKRTDVAIAAHIFEILTKADAQSILLITGDTDLVPAIETAKKLFPGVTIGVAFPYKRKNYELTGSPSRSSN